MKPKIIIVTEENLESTEKLIQSLRANGYHTEKIDSHFPQEIREAIRRHCASIIMIGKKVSLPIFEHRFIVHYLNSLTVNQMSAISTLANSVLTGKLLTDEKLISLIFLMKEAAEHQSKFLTAVLGEGQLDRTPSCSLIKAIDLAEKAYLADIMEMKIELKKDIDSNIEIHIPLYIAALAIANLLENAKDAIKKLIHKQGLSILNEIPKFISFTTEEHDKVILLRIVDSGEGVSNEIKARIFEPKFSTKAFGGGWGLPLTREALTFYRASIELDEDESRPTTFIVKFPKKN